MLDIVFESPGITVPASISMAVVGLGGQGVCLLLLHVISVLLPLDWPEYSGHTSEQRPLRWWCWIFCNSFVRPRRFVRSFARILLDWIGSGSWSSLRRVMQCVWSVPSFAAQFAAFGWPERWRGTMIDWDKIVGNKIDSFYGFIPICSVDRVRGRAVV